MKIAGANTVPFPVEKVWDALLDPQVLVATIPGCERLESTGEHTYAMTVTAGVAAIKGTYDGSCSLSDQLDHRLPGLRHEHGLSIGNAPGTVDATVDVSFAPADGGGATEISYSADATVGGMVGGVGQRMLGSVSKRMAGEFFGNVGKALSGERPAVPAAPAGPGEAAAAGAAAQPAVFTAPPKAGGISSQDDVLKGIVVGAGLGLAGVIVGGLFGRRR